MTPGRRRLLVFLLLWGLPLALALGGALWVSHAGMIAVNVDGRGPGGDHVHLVVPAAMVNLALRFIPEPVCVTARGEMEHWGPVARALSRELPRCSDGVLVDVRGPGETTLIEKRGNCLVVSVDSRDEQVHVKIPLGTVSAVLAKLEKSRSFRPTVGTSGCLAGGRVVSL